MLQVGDELPRFEGPNQEEKIIKSEDFRGRRLVIFFYPKAGTPGCTAEACNLNENFDALKKAGYQILGISVDPVKNQKKFHEKYSFKFDLISDENKDIVEKFGVWQMKKFMGKEYMGIVRTTFLFDENALCTRVIEKVNTKAHAQQIIDVSVCK
ncbi:MAG: thioredoxin-dependent thiol peroxidase [Bergeyella sp.]|nr:thioredoxin-dependent thiol peroxidase [Bergeyella sp.]